MNQRGWLRVVEAVFAVLLVGGVLLFLISQNQDSSSNLSEEFYNSQLNILRHIEQDFSLRQEILNLNIQDDGSFLVPLSVKDYINSSLPFGYSCESKICLLNQVCNLEPSFFIDKGEIFSQGVAITANREIYSPKQLKLFCWVKK
jgi:hypothetical protein